MSKTVNITSAGIDPAADRQQRTRAYIIAMSVRTVCVLLMFVIPGWWVVIPAVGAIILPSIAVMIANIKAAPVPHTIEAVTPLALHSRQVAESAVKIPETLVVEAYTERRATGERISGAEDAE